MFHMLSAKDVIIILTGNIFFTTYRLLLPLFLGYLVSKLMSTEREYLSALRLRVSYVSPWFDRWSWYAPARLQM